MRAIILVSVFVLAACGQASETNAPMPDQSNGAMATEVRPSDDEGQSEIRKVSDAELAKALGAECPAVTKSEYKGKTSDQVFYAVQCGGNEVLLGINLDGSTKGVPCSLAEALDTPCWKPWLDSE